MTSRRTRRLSLLVAFATAVVASAVITATVVAAQARARVDAWVDEEAHEVALAVGDILDGVVADLDAVAAFVEQQEPSPQAFDAFVHRIDGTAAAIGVGMVSVVPVDQVDDHVREVRAQRGEFYDIYRLSTDGGLVPVDRLGRDTFYPVQLFTLGSLVEPFVKDVPAGEIGVGIDPGSEASWLADVEAAVVAGAPAISNFLTVNVDAVNLDRIFFVSVPVHDENGEVCGLVAAPMLEPLLLADVGDRAGHGAEWEVVPVGGEPRRVVDGRSFTLETPGRTWTLAFAPTDETLRRLRGVPPVVGAAVGGAIAATVMLVVALALGRQSERRRIDDLRRAADDKDRFLATVSHELRTPLTAVAGIAHELRDRPQDFSPAEEHSLLGLLVEQTDELAAIVEDLLIAARSDIGKVVIRHETIDLIEEASRAMETAGISADTVGLPAPAWADAQRVRQILRNLLSNARKYGGPVVRMEFESGPTWVDVTVADNGNGVPVDQRRRVFESYTSAHAPSRAVESIGLGLFISRGLAGAMGGDLTYDYVDGWSRFRLRLPRPARDTAEPTPPAPTRSVSAA